jgi:hypothetical protein
MHFGMKNTLNSQTGFKINNTEQDGFAKYFLIKNKLI